MIANSAPLPNSDVTVSCPPCFSSIIYREVANPKSAPLLPGLVINK